MFKFSFPYGSGTKEDPFRVPYVPYGKSNTNKVRPAVGTVVMSSNHGPNELDLFLVTTFADGNVSTGIIDRQLDEDGILTVDFELAARKELAGPVRLTIGARKYMARRNGYYINGKAEWDEDFKHSTRWGASEYYVTQFTEVEQADWDAKFAPKEEPTVVVEPVILKDDEELTVADVVENIDDFKLSELKELVDVLNDRMEELKAAIEDKLENDVVEDDYIEENQDGVNFVVSHEWVEADQLVLNVALDRVSEFKGFSSFQFDVPFVEGTDFLYLSTKDTYFEGGRNGWMYRAFENNELNKVRVGGFASSNDKIVDDGNLIKLVYHITDATVDEFTFDFAVAKVDGLRDPINPKNPRHIVNR